MISRGHWQDLIQMFSLHPKLVFARDIASVFASFEHRDDHHLHCDRCIWFLFLRDCDGPVTQPECRDTNAPHHPIHYSVLQHLCAPAMLSFHRRHMLASGNHLVYERIAVCQEELRLFGSERIALMKKKGVTQQCVAWPRSYSFWSFCLPSPHHRVPKPMR